MDDDRQQMIYNNKLVFNYVEARIKFDHQVEELRLANEQLKKLSDAMQDAWRACRHLPKGVYSFKEHGCACVVLAEGDYPPLSVIR